MEIYKLIALQTIAHLLADYTFQSKATAQSKDQKGFRSPHLKWHILIVFICHVVLALDYRFIPIALVIALLHWLIDGCKPLLLRSPLKKGAFFIDQVLHITTYTLASILYYREIQWYPVLTPEVSFKLIVLIASFLFLTKPANIIIREIFTLFDISFSNNKGQDLPNAGKLIGITERWMVFVFVLIGQFSAVGFLIAAKSILRFKDGDLIKTEYVLIGTMLSFSLAIAVALVYQSII